LVQALFRCSGVPKLVTIEKDKIVFRRATIDDVPTLIDCRIRFLNELYNHSEDEKTRILRKSLVEYLTRAIPSRDFISWIAEYDGRIIATSGMVIWEIPGRYGGVESGKQGYLLNFYTFPEARRMGIATRLLKELIKEAQLLGIKSLHLHASKYGINIYKKAGFTEPEMPELVLQLNQTNAKAVQ